MRKGVRYLFVHIIYQGKFDLVLIGIVGAAGCMAGSIVSNYVGFWLGRHWDKIIAVFSLLDVLIVILLAHLAVYFWKKRKVGENKPETVEN